MSAAVLYQQAAERGVHLRLVGVSLKASGEPAALEALMPALKLHKPELIEFMAAAERLTAELIEAAMRRCDQWNDGPQARQDMVDQVLEVPLHLRSDLLQHFQKTPKDET